MYRPITDAEFAKIIETNRAFSHWQRWREFAQSVYGPDVTRLELETNWESDDEGGAYCYVANVSAYGSNKQYLDPDLTLPFFDKLENKEDEDWIDEYIKEGFPAWKIDRNDEDSLDFTLTPKTVQLYVLE